MKKKNTIVWLVLIIIGLFVVYKIFEFNKWQAQMREHGHVTNEYQQ